MRQRTSWSKRRSGGVAFPPHRGMQRRCLLLVPRRTGGGIGGRRRRTTRRPTDGCRLGDAGGESSPTLGASSASVRHGCDEAMECRTVERRFWRTPTWRAKCWISVSGKTLKVRTLGCAWRSLPYRSTSDPLVRTKMKMMNNTRDTRFILVRATVVV